MLTRLRRGAPRRRRVVAPASPSPARCWRLELPTGIVIVAPLDSVTTRSLAGHRNCSHAGGSRPRRRLPSPRPRSPSASPPWRRRRSVTLTVAVLVVVSSLQLPPAVELMLTVSAVLLSTWRVVAPRHRHRHAVGARAAHRDRDRGAAGQRHHQVAAGHRIIPRWRYRPRCRLPSPRGRASPSASPPVASASSVTLTVAALVVVSAS